MTLKHHWNIFCHDFDSAVFFSYPHAVSYPDLHFYSYSDSNFDSYSDSDSYCVDDFYGVCDRGLDYYYDLARLVPRLNYVIFGKTVVGIDLHHLDCVEMTGDGGHHLYLYFYDVRICGHASRK